MVAGPPSASHAASTLSRSATRPRRANAASITAVSRANRARPSADISASRAASRHNAGKVSAAPALSTNADKSANFSPQNGARKRLSMATRSAGWTNARVSAMRSRMAWRSPRRSKSRPQNPMPRRRRAAATAVRWRRVRPRTATLSAGNSVCVAAMRSAMDSASMAAAAAGVTGVAGVESATAACTNAPPPSAATQASARAYLTAPAAASSCAGNAASKVALNQSTKAGRERKFAVSCSDSKPTSPTHLQSATLRKFPTSASRKR